MEITALDALLTVGALAFLIFIHELGHFLAAKLFGMRVDEFSLCFPPRLISKKIGETRYSIGLIPLGGFVKIYGEADSADARSDVRSFVGSKPWKRAVVAFAGVAMNFLVGFLVLSAVFFTGTPQRVMVREVKLGSAASDAGFMPGDIIEGFKTSSEVAAFVRAHQGEAVTLDVQRNGITKRVSVTPKIVQSEKEGALGVVLFDQGVVKRPLYESVRDGWFASWSIAGQIVVGVYGIVQQLVTSGTLSKDVAGPVGIFTIAHRAAAENFLLFLQLIGLISLNLAVANMLPFPIVDGGRLVMIGVEKLKGSPPPAWLEMGLNMTGLILLLGLMVLVTVRDIGNLIY